MLCKNKLTLKHRGNVILSLNPGQSYLRNVASHVNSICMARNTSVVFQIFVIIQSLLCVDVFSFRFFLFFLLGHLLLFIFVMFYSDKKYKYNFIYFIDLYLSYLVAVNMVCGIRSVIDIWQPTSSSPIAVSCPELLGYRFCSQYFARRLCHS